MRWGVVVPVKSLATAKSRLEGWTGADRAELALAFARDTIEAALVAKGVDMVIVVTNDLVVSEVIATLPVLVVAEPATPGLNAALSFGAELLGLREPHVGVAAVCADLPALRAEELSAALAHAAAHDRAFLADAAGTGTTMLTSRPGRELDPHFGLGSADAHARSGATALVGSFASVRQDVDGEDDLAAALALGVGPWTAAVLAVS